MPSCRCHLPESGGVKKAVAGHIILIGLARQSQRPEVVTSRRGVLHDYARFLVGESEPASGGAIVIIKEATCYLKACSVGALYPVGYTACGITHLQHLQRGRKLFLIAENKLARVAPFDIID